MRCPPGLRIVRGPIVDSVITKFYTISFLDLFGSSERRRFDHALAILGLN